MSNGARLETALASNSEDLYLGAVQYEDPNAIQIGRQNRIGRQNGFNTLMVKSASYSYEQEVRLVHSDMKNYHDPIPDFSWNEETMRFDNIVEDHRPLTAGLALQCDVDVLVERVIVSPFAPSWYLPMIEQLRDQLGFQFPAVTSRLLAAPPVIP